MGEGSKTDMKTTESDIVEEQQLGEKIVNEEFKIWKKTVPLLYDTIHTHALDFLSLSLQWLPDYEVNEDKNSIKVKFLFGTNSSLNSQDYLKLGSLSVASTLAPDFLKFSSSQSIPVPMSNVNKSDNFRILSSWKHNGEINKLKLSPDSTLSLTFDNKGIVHLYDLTSNKNPVEFKYHKLEGFALDWTNGSRFLSGANDSQIALWDINKPSTPIKGFKSHNAVINEISDNKNTDFMFGSVADDFTIQVHDIRADIQENPAMCITTKQLQNSIAFHPDISFLFAVGGKDNNVSLYDLRYPKEPIRKLFGHNDSILGVKWNPLDKSNLYSWALDKRTLLWDLSKLDEYFAYPNGENNESSRKKQSRNDDPCLSFIHGGHINRINDVDVHPRLGLYASCGDDNLLEVWKPKTIASEEEEPENTHRSQDPDSQSANSNGVESKK